MWRAGLVPGRTRLMSSAKVQGSDRTKLWRGFNCQMGEFQLEGSGTRNHSWFLSREMTLGKYTRVFRCNMPGACHQALEKMKSKPAPTVCQTQPRI